jgi:hypothetical protein
MLTHLIQRRKAGGLDRLTNNPPNINMMTIVDASIRRARTTSDAIELYRNAKLAVEREVSSISNTKKPKCAAEQVSPVKTKVIISKSETEQINIKCCWETDHPI